MTTPQPAPAAPIPATPFGLFLVRIRRLPGTAMGEVSGYAERVGTGEKRPFSSRAELTQVIAEWDDRAGRAAGRER